MNTKNVGSNDQKQISDIKTDNTAQISGKTIKLATTQTNTTQIDAKISDANLQGKGAKKGFWGIVRTIALNPVSAVSSALYVAAHIALHPVNALFHPAQTLKEGFNDSLLADKFNAAPTKTNDSIKEQADKLEKEKSSEDKLVLSDQEMPMSDAKDVYEQNKQKSAQVEQVTPVASEADFSEIAQENHSKDTQDTTPTKISEKDIKESWSKSTFANRYMMCTTYNVSVKNMPPFWGKFCAWFQALFSYDVRKQTAFVNELQSRVTQQINLAEKEINLAKKIQPIVQNSIEHAQKQQANAKTALSNNKPEYAKMHLTGKNILVDRGGEMSRASNLMLLKARQSLKQARALIFSNAALSNIYQERISNLMLTALEESIKIVSNEQQLMKLNWNPNKKHDAQNTQKETKIVELQKISKNETIKTQATAMKSVKIEKPTQQPKVNIPKPVAKNKAKLYKTKATESELKQLLNNEDNVETYT